VTQRRDYRIPVRSQKSDRELLRFSLARQGTGNAAAH
jgi:hypothetical protein